jgi:ferredoxin
MVKTVVGWTLSRTLGSPRLTWIAKPEEAEGLIAPGLAPGNIARALKHPALKNLAPLGLVVRPAELRALNVLSQEKQLAAGRLLLFAYDAAGKFAGALDWNAAQKALLGAEALREAGGAPETLRRLDELAAKSAPERWAFWRSEFERCLKCYACRQSCPLCNCEQCLADKNQPQWFPTAADGPGNLAWHIVRAFHNAGRCVACGACEDSCPAGLPLNLLNAALARSAAGRFGYVAGAKPDGAPLQADFRPDDKEHFIL